MENSFEFSDVLKGESKTKQILMEVNRINEAKHNNALLSNELAGVIISIGEIYSNQLKNNTNKTPNEDFENLIPDFDYETKYFKHEKLSSALKIVREANTASIFSYEERYKENESGFVKAA